MTIAPEYYATHRFWVEIQSITQGAFSECSGLEQEIDVLDWPEGGYNTGVHRLPGRVKAAPNLVLKRGLIGGDLWQWFVKVGQGTITRHNLSIMLYGNTGQTDIRWNVIGALPVKWSGPALNAMSSTAAIETVELVYQRLERV